MVVNVVHKNWYLKYISALNLIHSWYDCFIEHDLRTISCIEWPLCGYSCVASRLNKFLSVTIKITHKIKCGPKARQQALNSWYSDFINKLSGLAFAPRKSILTRGVCRAVLYTPLPAQAAPHEHLKCENSVIRLIKRLSQFCVGSENCLQCY